MNNLTEEEAFELGLEASLGEYRLGLGRGPDQRTVPLSSSSGNSLVERGGDVIPAWAVHRPQAERTGGAASSEVKNKIPCLMRMIN